MPLPEALLLRTENRNLAVMTLRALSHETFHGARQFAIVGSGPSCLVTLAFEGVDVVTRGINRSLRFVCRTRLRKFYNIRERYENYYKLPDNVIRSSTDSTLLLHTGARCACFLHMSLGHDTSFQVTGSFLKCPVYM